MTQCGLIAIIGEPNAGKSTLINQLVGGKISIVTPKAQTTRFNVRGVCMAGETQLVFIDTPGIFQAGKQFEKSMVKAAWSSISKADAVLLLIDAKTAIVGDALRERMKELIEKCSTVNKPICLALNKVDAMDKTALLSLAAACAELCTFERVFMISALKGDGVKDIKFFLAGMMPEGPFLYPQDQMSDIPMRLLAAEVTREKIFFALEQELPYAVHVENETWEESGTLIKIAQAIHVQREGQKKIVLGNKGDMIKRIGTLARKELESMTEKRVHLTLFVKVTPEWKDSAEFYHGANLLQ